MAQYQKAIDILTRELAKVRMVAQALFEREKISGEEFREMMEQA